VTASAIYAGEIMADLSSDNIIVLSVYAGEIMADLSSDNIIVLSVYDGDEDRSVEIDREVFKEFVKTIEEV
jgi:hypothetical protein